MACFLLLSWLVYLSGRIFAPIRQLSFVRIKTFAITRQPGRSGGLLRDVGAARWAWDGTSRPRHQPQQARSMTRLAGWAATAGRGGAGRGQAEQRSVRVTPLGLPRRRPAAGRAP